MSRTLTLDGRAVLEPKLRQDRRGLFYMRVHDPAQAPARRDIPLGTRDAGEARVLFAQHRMEYLACHLDPWAVQPATSKRTATTLTEAVEQYCEEAGVHVRASTRKCRRVRLEPFSRRLPGVSPSAPRAEHVYDYCFSPKLKPSTQKRYLEELRAFFGWCQKTGLRKDNPAADVAAALPRHRKRKRQQLAPYLTPDDVRAWLSVLEADLRANPAHASREVLADVIRLAVLTGLRRGELCRLRWADVTLYNPPRPSPHGPVFGWISVVDTEDGQTKTDEGRVPLVEAAAMLLARRKAANERSASPSVYVLPGPRGGMLDGVWLGKRFREYADLAVLPKHLHFHSLRHTCASWLAEAGVDLRAIQAVMRHADLRQTLRYATLHPDVAAARMAKAFAPMAEFAGASPATLEAPSSCSKKNPDRDRTSSDVAPRAEPKTSRAAQRRVSRKTARQVVTQFSLFGSDPVPTSQNGAA